MNARLAAFAVVIAAALAAQPMRATAINNLVITENSSTSLTATYNGNPATVINIGPDLWILANPGVFFNDTIDRVWTEPDNAAGINNFGRVGPSLGDVVDIQSDLSGSGGNPNGTTVPNLGTDSTNGGSVSVTFFDNGDVATAADTGSTLGLLALALAALAGASRLRSLQST